MNARKFIAPLIPFTLTFLLVSVAEAGYTWTGVSPSTGGSGSGTSQSFGATVNWDVDNDAAPVGGSIQITIHGGNYMGTVSTNQSYTSAGGTAAFSGTVSFDPPLPSGTSYTIEFRLSFPGPPYTGGTGTTVTVP